MTGTQQLNGRVVTNNQEVLHGNGGNNGESFEHAQAWWKEAIIYQIYPASYADSNGDGIGDIQGIIGKLDYIKQLGVDAIWLSPHYKSPQDDMGYDISDYRDIHEPYGTLADCEALMKGCHDRGMKIIFDLVINHTSSEHAWFKESRSSKSSPKRDWYIWAPPRGFDNEGRPIPPSNWRAAFGGSVWEWDEATQEYYLHLFLKGQPDLNWEREDVRKAIYDEAITFWLERGLDGFRIDTACMYSKDFGKLYTDLPVTDPTTPWQRSDDQWTNGPRLFEFIQEMSQETFNKYGAVTIGEWPYTPDFKEVLKYVSAKNSLLSMVFQFEIVIIDHGIEYRHFAREWNLPELKGYLKRFQEMIRDNDGWQTNFLENHDQARSVTRFTSDAPEYRQVGAKMLCIYLMTLTGTTFVYQGEEYGEINAGPTYGQEEYKDCDTIGFWEEMNRLNDPEKIKRGIKGSQLTARDHGRLPISWSAGEQAGFTSGTAPWMRVNPNHTEVNVESQLEDPSSVLAFYRKMIAFRREHKDVMVYGRFDMIDPEADKTIVYTKTAARGGKQAVVALNWTKERVPFEMPQVAGEPRLAVSNVEKSEMGVLEPFEGRVYLVGA